MVDPVRREASREANRAKWAQPGYREAMAEKQRKAWADPSIRQRQASIRQSSEYRARIAARVQEVWAEPGYRERVSAKMSASDLRRAQDPTYRATQALVHANRDKPSGLHLAVKAGLEAAGLALTTHAAVGYYSLDEADLIRKVAVEIQGCYWHSCPVCGCRGPKTTLARDKSRRTYLKNHGWTLVEVWEHEWKTDPQACVGRVASALNP